MCWGGEGGVVVGARGGGCPPPNGHSTLDVRRRHETETDGAAGGRGDPTEGESGAGPCPLPPHKQGRAPHPRGCAAHPGWGTLAALRHFQRGPGTATRGQSGAVRGAARASPVWHGRRRALHQRGHCGALRGHDAAAGLRGLRGGTARASHGAASLRHNHRTAPQRRGRRTHFARVAPQGNRSNAAPHDRCTRVAAALRCRGAAPPPPPRRRAPTRRQTVRPGGGARVGLWAAGRGCAALPRGSRSCPPPFPPPPCRHWHFPRLLLHNPGPGGCARWDPRAGTGRWGGLKTFAPKAPRPPPPPAAPQLCHNPAVPLSPPPGPSYGEWGGVQRSLCCPTPRGPSGC